MPKHNNKPLINKRNLQLVILVFCYLVLTIPLMNNAFWHDEIYNTSLYLNAFPNFGFNDSKCTLQGPDWLTGWQRQLAVHPPLISIIYYGWINLFGDSEISLHIPVALAGLLGIILLYLLGCLLFDEDVAFMAALALTFSSSHIIYSVQAVHASFEMLIVLASILAFAKFVITKKRKLFVVLLALNVLGFCIFYYYFFYFIIQTIVLWIFRRDLKIKLLYFFIASLLAVFFVGFVTANYNKKLYAYTHWPKNNFSRIIKNIIYLPRNFTQ